MLVKNLIGSLLLIIGLVSIAVADERSEALAKVKTDFRLMKSVSTELKQDKNFVLDVVKTKSLALKYVDESLKKDKDVVIAATKDYSGSFDYAHKSLKRDREFALKIVKISGDTLIYLDKTLQSDREIVEEALKTSGLSLGNASKSLRADKKLVLLAISDHPAALKYTTDNLKNDKAFIRKAVEINGWSLEYASDTLKKHYKTCLSAVKNNSKALDYVDESLLRDSSFIQEIIEHHGKSIQAEIDLNLEKADKANAFIKLLTSVKPPETSPLKNASDDIKKNKKVVLEALKSDPLALEFADSELQGNKEVALAAVSRNGLALEFVDYFSLARDRDVVLAAVTQNGLALEHARGDLDSNKEIVMKAISQNGLALEHANYSTMRSNIDIARIAVKNNKSASEFYSGDYSEDSKKNESKEIAITDNSSSSSLTTAPASSSSSSDTSAVDIIPIAALLLGLIAVLFAVFKLGQKSKSKNSKTVDEKPSTQSRGSIDTKSQSTKQNTDIESEPLTHAKKVFRVMLVASMLMLCVFFWWIAGDVDSLDLISRAILFAIVAMILIPLWLHNKSHQNSSFQKNLILFLLIIFSIVVFFSSSIEYDYSLDDELLFFIAVILAVVLWLATYYYLYLLTKPMKTWQKIFILYVPLLLSIIACALAIYLVFIESEEEFIVALQVVSFSSLLISIIPLMVSTILNYKHNNHQVTGFVVAYAVIVLPLVMIPYGFLLDT